MKINDLVGLSKPLTRLIEVISRGIGAVSTPYLIRKIAEAKAHEIKVIADALEQVRDKNQLPVVYTGGTVDVWQKPDDGTLVLGRVPLEQRIDNRLDYQHHKRQENLERITSAAAAELTGETAVPDEKPDEDWVTRFFNTAQDISSAQMQELWGRILAGEIKQPGSYSLRTLGFVKNLTQGEAKILEMVGRFALKAANASFIAIHDKKWLESRAIYASHHFMLGELGLMYPTDLTLQLFRKPQQQTNALMSDDFLVLIRRSPLTSQINLPIWKFTSIGEELLSLVSKVEDAGYLDSIGLFLVEKHAEVSLCKISGPPQPDGNITYVEVRKLGERSHTPPAATVTDASTKGTSTT